MSDKNKNNDEYLDLSEFNKKYEHYANSDADIDIKEENLSPQEYIDEYEDIVSYSEGNADFYMQPREEEASENDVYISKQSIEIENENRVKRKSDGNFFTRNKYRNVKIIALLLVISLLLVFGGALAYLYIVTGEGNYGDSGFDYNNPSDEPTEENHNWQSMGDVDANSLNDYLYSWANNGGEKMYSKNVINVLLCGVDSETGTASEGRSDIMMLVSINQKTKTITLVSLLRDSWTYMSLPRQDGSYYDYYFKMNSAYSYGGPATLLNTIENNYKIEIDQYIAVDFASFPKLIDALGGVTVEVQEYEANYIRRTSSHKKFPSGKATLNGDQALIYSRIRKCDSDSDISRTRRQRSVIKALVDSAKTATNGQLLNAFTLVSPYLRTGYTQSEVFALIAQAYTNGWMNYDMVEVVLPSEDYVDRASTSINGHWTWIVDYPYCAQKLQLALYGQSNIVLDDDRTSVLDLMTNVNQSGNSSVSSSEEITLATQPDEPSSSEPDEPSSDEESTSVDPPSFTWPTRPSHSEEVTDSEPSEDETSTQNSAEATEPSSETEQLS